MTDVLRFKWPTDCSKSAGEVITVTGNRKCENISQKHILFSGVGSYISSVHDRLFLTSIMRGKHQGLAQCCFPRYVLAQSALHNIVLNLAGNEILFFVKVAFCEKKNICTRIECIWFSPCFIILFRFYSHAGSFLCNHERDTNIMYLVFSLFHNSIKIL